MEQSRDPEKRGRIGGRSGRTSEHKITEPIFVKGLGCKTGEFAMNADGLAWGGLCSITERGLRGFLATVGRSAEGA